MWSDLVIWIVVNIFFPVVAPLLLLLLPKVPKKMRPYAKGLVLKAVQDGQLFWLTVALCAVGAYELYAYAQVVEDQSSKIGAWGVIGLLLLFWGISVVLGVLSALNVPEHPGTAVPAVSSPQKEPAEVLAGNASEKTKAAAKPRVSPDAAAKPNSALGVAPGPDMGMVITSAVFLFIVSVIAIVAHHLAATTTQSAILLHEKAWEEYASCIVAREPNVPCPKPKEPSK